LFKVGHSFTAFTDQAGQIRRVQFKVSHSAIHLYHYRLIFHSRGHLWGVILLSQLNLAFLLHLDLIGFGSNVPLTRLNH
jgi:hypothetical protein